ncbi:conserved hypothetical protein [Methylomarinovum tepidoasis]|uniref:UPF0125 protein MIN45_P2208 n=1 Tax=Methylomarinovum tepidoasis TaxID=2840183 RepID=A0AAU9CB97_9GAMM|nr:RnfH family protein [Methylomarinovum sp. IN45]BCX89835.1 conserved hypothetical protein [Methylomarinovum sp. IN45]
MADWVEVVYALPEIQVVRRLPWHEGMTVAEAIEACGLTARFPEIDLERQPVGVFGRICPLTRELRPGERVEIYRPLRCDPKEARRLRVRQPRTGGGRNRR